MKKEKENDYSNGENLAEGWGEGNEIGTEFLQKDWKKGPDKEKGMRMD